MKLTCKVKLDCSHEQLLSIMRTLAACNAAADVASGMAFDNKKFSRDSIHKLVYKSLRAQFGLSAQTAVRVIGKVADVYKVDKENQRKFRKHGAIPFDARNLSFSKDKSSISIRLLDGRVSIPLVTADYQKNLLQYPIGESDLLIQKGEAYLSCSVEAPEAPLRGAAQYLGVDFGIVNIAADNTGKTYSGKEIEEVRKRISELRAALQSKGTKSAKRHLKRLAKKEALFRRQVNHVISKELVEKAKDTHSCLVLEELTGINKRVKVKKTQRAKHMSWAFFQLREFVSYKALRAGVLLMIVHAAYSSQECSACHFVSKKNRKSQSDFECGRCGHAQNADLNAAQVIAYRAHVSEPIVAVRDAARHRALVIMPLASCQG